MSSVNRAIILGRLGQNPDVRVTKDGKKVVTLNVATSERWTEKASGDKREATEWHKVVIFSEGLCRIAESYLSKGDQVYVEGGIKTRKWQDKNGVDRYSTEIVLNGFNSSLVLLGGKSDGDAKPKGNYANKEVAGEWDDAPAGDFDDFGDRVPW